MWSEVLTGATSAAIAGLISWAIAKTAARAEIQKLRETWAHEKEAAIDEEFDNMVAAVSNLIRFPSTPAAKEAVEKTALFRPKASGAMSDVVDEINVMLSRQCPNYELLAMKIDEAMRIKRETIVK